MKPMRYLKNVTTLTLDAEACVGCGACQTVCPRGVLALEEKRAVIIDRDGCIECGACATNCPTLAVQVTPGAGCAAYIISSWIHGPENASCGGDGGCC
ncbi:MAG: 4Fe-4S dicluster domain-containing protein [Desulfobacterales bacterium]|nr:4Fe-4S dicluster domain-containing protein [Desulfobacterales bacterium]